jgi:hypothetical protein
MQTLPHGNGALPRLATAAPEGPAPGREIRRVSVAREDVVLRPAAPPRSPSNPESAGDTVAVVVDDVDEVLVADSRAGVTPAEMVELKLRSLLRGSAVSIARSGTTPPGRGPSPRG